MSTRTTSFIYDVGNCNKADVYEEVNVECNDGYIDDVRMDESSLCLLVTL